MHPVRFKNICKKYDGKEILHNVSFVLEQSKITVLIGRSGSGKSTLLKMINALVKPTSGELFVYDKNIADYDLNVLRSGIGYSVQGTSLFPHLNIYRNISLVAGLRKMNKQKINERISELMKLVNLREEFKSKYPYQLSGGEQQRAGLCRALMMNPGIILLDEAFGALDVTIKNEIHKELLNIQRSEPRTMLLVTHDLNEAIKLADKLIIIEEGEIQQQGTKEEILSSPSNEFVKLFLAGQLN